MVGVTPTPTPISGKRNDLFNDIFKTLYMYDRCDPYNMNVCMYVECIHVCIQ